MPFINTKTNIALSRKQKELAKNALADCIAALNPDWTKVLMVDFEDSCALSFAGDSLNPCAIVCVNLLDKAVAPIPAAAMEKVLAAVTEVISKTFVIDTDKVVAYYNYSPCWALGGKCI